ncbi:hypothetical protein LOK46_06180 [Methylobacterium sp. NMS14P]|uniref:rhamnan synthesis F family protein n=1 Tax=Methylobacterium sp. NMS14P TaxID=2894310 RepID=UPI0023595AD0|nr:rhamnan synthesis F family protein [Methylobacterium sp. NMS14P]WCS26420.1 hypothetical protein LOK46_06180 [Methylobacterium sp. NMS14P]
MNEHGLTDLDPVWYLQRYADIAASGMTASDHFTAYGRREGRVPNAGAESLLNADAFDPSWYAAFYADSIEQGSDPISHYLLVGKGRRYFPNDKARQRAALVEAFDPIWYLRRNRDVAESGMEPLHHFLAYGHAEGRSPNERAESRARWRGWFDPEWYTARYDDVGTSGLSPLEHYLRLGIYEGRAPNTAAENRAAWDGVFDAQWYTRRYDDIASSGLSPLEHFIAYGIIAGRKPNASAVPEHEAIERAQLTVVKAGAVSSRVVLFVTHAPGGQIKPHVVEHLTAYKTSRISVVLIAASDASQIHVSPSVSQLADVIVRRDNRGYDFAAWAHLLRENPDFFQKDIVFLANDSVFGPLTQDAFNRTLAAIDASEADIVGLTDNFQLGWHLQSYFLAIKSRALTAAPFQRFINEVVSYRRKNDVIAEYETKFTRVMSDQGLTCAALYQSTDQSNATLDSWRDLTRDGMPYVKASLFNRCTVKIDITGWRQQLNGLGYDTARADRSLALTCRSAQHDDMADYSRGLVSQRNALYNLHQFFATGSQLALRKCISPTLSIVIISHNQAEFLYPLMQIFGETQFSTEVELIILDHASTDDTTHLASNVEGCAFHHLPAETQAIDFVAEAVRLARGRRILLLRQAVFFNRDLIEMILPCGYTELNAEFFTGTLKENLQYVAHSYPSTSGRQHLANAIQSISIIAKRAGENPADYMMLFESDAFVKNFSLQIRLPQDSDPESSFSALLQSRGLVPRSMKHISIVTV